MLLSLRQTSRFAASPRWNAPERARQYGAGSQHGLNIALCVPLGGSAGIWGPSALSCARLAVAELNRHHGIAGQHCRLVTINASDDAPDIEETLLDLVGSGDVDALVGMHTSNVRQRIVRAVGGQVPFVYTPLYEGGENTPGVFAIGETARRQLQPAIAWLGQHKQPKRWLAVGNDYVWPRVSHSLAQQYIADAGGQLVAQTYVPFGTSDYSQVLGELRKSRIDAVLVSLVGQDAIDFNRAFGRSHLSGQMLRLSCAIDENELLGIGADNTENLYVACGYFSTLDTDANLAFKERYYNHFGERAPTLNTLGQSTYEGVHFLAALLKGTLDSPALWDELGKAPMAYQSARQGAYAGDGVNHTPIYLARAEGNVFRVITRF
jgi:urea transport system substrate-binding protein